MGRCETIFQPSVMYMTYMENPMCIPYSIMNWTSFPQRRYVIVKPTQSFELDTGTAKAIEELKEVFGVKSNEDVIRKAIAFSRIAARNSNREDHTVTPQSLDDKQVKISLTE